MKCSGKRSACCIASTESGSINTFANGVAVNPTYVEFMKRLQICRMSLLVRVGSVSSLRVFTDALSASSSISSMGTSTYPFTGSIFCSLNQLKSRWSTETFFFMTNNTRELFANDIVILLQLPTKSLSVDVTEVALICLLSKPTPTRGYFSILPSFFRVIPTMPSSIRSCVCLRRFSVMPVSRMTTLYPASAALHINPV